MEKLQLSIKFEEFCTRVFSVKLREQHLAISLQRLEHVFFEAIAMLHYNPELN